MQKHVWNRAQDEKFNFLQIVLDAYSVPPHLLKLISHGNICIIKNDLRGVRGHDLQSNSETAITTTI